MSQRMVPWGEGRLKGWSRGERGDSKDGRVGRGGDSKDGRVGRGGDGESHASEALIGCIWSRAVVKGPYREKAPSTLLPMFFFILA
jgi:hypothetical protein